MRRILVTGASGLIGSAICLELEKSKVWEVYCPSSKVLDMESPTNVNEVFSQFRPEIVINLAARVGGIKANLSNPVDFFLSNIDIGVNTYRYAARFGVKKIINAGAGCGYPLLAPEPLIEEDLWKGLPQEESMPYSTAKKLLTILGEIYEKEYGIISTTFIPSNVYGPRDNFSIEKGHVIPALIHKFFDAKQKKKHEIVVIGDGKAKRDFIYVEDLAKAMLLGIHANKTDVINVATGNQVTIRELVEELVQIFEYDGKIMWDVKGPIGSSSRLMNIEKVRKGLGDWTPISLREGLRATVEWFQGNYLKGGVRL